MSIDSIWAWIWYAIGCNNVFSKFEWCQNQNLNEVWKSIRQWINKSGYIEVCHVRFLSQWIEE